MGLWMLTTVPEDEEAFICRIAYITEQWNYFHISQLVWKLGSEHKVWIRQG